MRKTFFLTPLAALALASCADNEFLGGEEAQHVVNGDKPILFESGTKALTRGDKTGEEAATLLNNNFVIEGIKGDGSNQVEVFDHYNVNFKAGTANSTETNVKDWEYVGQAKHALSAVSQQTIKYWDYSQSQYDFVGFSYGQATTAPTLSEIKYANLSKATDTGTPVYTVKGKVSDLAQVYVSNLITAYKTSPAGVPTEHDIKYQSIITPKFRQMGTKIRVAIYETVPGYSVTGLKFYADKTRTNTPSDKPILFTTDNAAVLPALGGEGTMSVYFPTVGASNVTNTDYNKAHVVFTKDGDGDLTSTLEFGALNYTSKEDNEKSATGDVFLGRTSPGATYAGESSASYYVLILPYGSGTDLNLHVDYTLVPIDGAEETIEVKSATALVPSVYTNWQPNYAYTYIFKISKNTNGTTGDPDDPNDPVGLYPIVFDAVVMDFGDGIQETITTVSDPSITTYAKGVEPTATSEYTKDKNIYVSVDQATVALDASNAKLYTATVETGALQGIDEGSVANALVNGKTYKVKSVTTGDPVDGLYTYADGTYTACASGAVAVDGTTYYEADTSSKTVIDADGKALTVSAASGLTFVNEIAAADATDGNAVAGKFAVFKPSVAGNYVFEYSRAAVAAVLYADATEYNTAKGTSLNDSEFAALSEAERTKTPAVPAGKFYKIIIVHD